MKDALRPRNASSKTSARTLFAALSVLLLLLTACGGDDESPYQRTESPLDPSRALAEIRPQDDGSLLVYTEVVIEAEPEQVWEVLTDFEAMPEWSSTLQGVSGELEDGGEGVAVYLNEGVATEFPHVLSWDDGHSFSWSDEIAFAPGIVDDHRFIVHSTDGDSTLFVQTDQLTGDNADLPAPLLAELLTGSYSLFNQEFKAEVERRF